MVTKAILVVEDEAIIAADIARTLEALGYEVIATAESGREALRAAEARRPDLALMDIQLKGRMDGVETARTLGTLHGVPVVFLTSFSDDATLERAKEAQPYGYLVKPFDNRELRTAIEVALHRHGLEARLAQTERRLTQAERLASLGTLAAGMAHEINNPLSYVTANLELAVEGVESLAASLGATAAPDATRLLTELREVLADARHGAERVRRIVQDIGRFAGAEEYRRSSVDLQVALDEAVRIAEATLERSLTVHRAYALAPMVSGDAAQLAQVFVNLLINAAQAIERTPGSDPVVRLVTGTDDTGRAFAEVQDAGPGISAEVLARVFDPFYTTRPVGAGVGLGLSVCHGIVAAMGGEITVHSGAGPGTTVRVALPAVANRDSVQH